MLSFRAAVAASLLALSALPALAHDGVHIDGAYARFMPGAKSGAAFFIIENHATVDEKLLSVSSDVANKTELHTHKADANGMMQMLPIEGGIAIAPGQTHELKRGGDHVMMMDLKTVPKDGDTIHLILTFEHAGAVEIDVPVDNKQ